MMSTGPLATTLLIDKCAGHDPGVAREHMRTACQRVA
jgi:hypothetical protein